MVGAEIHVVVVAEMLLMLLLLLLLLLLLRNCAYWEYEAANISKQFRHSLLATVKTLLNYLDYYNQCGYVAVASGAATVVATSVRVPAKPGNQNGKNGQLQ